jgi:PAS domain S-box-containing protein
VDEIVKLLLVDDEERNLDALEAILASLDCTFVRAISADEALLALLQHEFAAIILDIKMPGMSGTELAQLIKTRKRNRQVPILFLTAHMLEEKDVLEAYGVGGADYISKPINPQILRSKVGVFVDLFRSNRALGNAVDALQGEIAERERVQEELRVAKEELEIRVLERTAELDRANREVRDNQERLRLALAVAQVAAWEWDLESGKMNWSADPEIVFGFPAGAFGPDCKITNAAHPDDVPTIEAAIRQAFETGELDIEYRAVRPNGTVVWIADRGRVIQQAAGRPVRIVGVSVDLTVRRSAEQALRNSEATLSAISQNMPALVYLMDAENRFIHINRRFEQLLGKSSEEVIGRSVYDILPLGTATIFDINNRHVLEIGETVEFEETITVSDGPHVYTSIRAPLFDRLGTPYNVVAVSTDITERKRLEDALRQADHHKNEFLATLAHELRNPLAPIRYALQVVHLKGPLSAELSWAVGLIERQTQHMARLVDDLLDINRIARNTLELRRGPVELTGIIESVVETNRPFIERSGHELTVVLPEKPIHIDADAVRLAQVFSNLLHNAAKFGGKGPEDGGHISLIAEEDGEHIVVSIKDTGIGIHASMLSRVFEMFTQVGRSLEQTKGGLGIGLSLAKRLIEMHGGTIEARSEGLGKGSEFVVRLPMAAESPRFESSSGDYSTPEVGKRRILIADDNPDVAEAFEMMLQAIGHDVETAHDGIEVIEKAERYQPDIIVLDIGMPKLNGYDVARHLRKQPWGRDIVLVAVTGWGDEKDKGRSHAAGFDVHLVKPVDPGALGSLLSSINR